MPRRVALLLLSAVVILAPGGGILRSARAADPPTAKAAEEALRKAVGFYTHSIAVHGGYPYRTSTDLKLREGEGICSPSQVWVQPPGTPAVGEALLIAYDATGDASYLDAARETGRALAKGQLHSGGWTYSIDFDPAGRTGTAYRDAPLKKKQKNRATMDDDTTTASIRFLLRLDHTLKASDPAIHDAAESSYEALLTSQMPNGGWYVNWDGYPKTPPSEADYPVKPASLASSWNRTWTKAYDGCYVLNDDLIVDVLATLRRAHELKGDPRALKAIRRAGDFLLLAQLPEPQPAWAQQYNVNMQPTWARKFEPPAITGAESQGAIATLIVIARVTGDKKYTETVPKALAYLKRSQLPDGRLARFYEMNTNTPIYFTKNDYQVTDRDDRLPTHYGFKVTSNLDALGKAYQDYLANPKAPLKPTTGKPSRWSESLAARAAAAITALDARGAWVNPNGVMDAHDVKPPGGTIESDTFIKNVTLLADYIQAARAREAAGSKR